MLRSLFISLLVAGCSYTFDTSEPTLPYVGVQPDTAALPKLNTKTVDGEIFALGADKRVWLLLQSTDATWEMMPMSGDPASDQLASNEQMQLVTWRALYITRSGAAITDGGVPPDLAVGPDMAQPRGDM
ncbi:MAG: hypothetical protein JWM53_1737, partial [bacterium]|nr:hypothetical protein [bacterium]